jgi:hypothetical protein
MLHKAVDLSTEWEIKNRGLRLFLTFQRLPIFYLEEKHCGRGGKYSSRDYFRAFPLNAFLPGKSKVFGIVEGKPRNRARNL